MILIIGCNNAFAKKYSEYLGRNKIEHVFLSFQDIINDVSVFDNIEDKSNNCIWQTNNVRIDFSSITGIYHEVLYLEENLFFEFDAKDRNYARNEWFAYFVYRISQFENVINPIHHKHLNGSYFRWIFIFKIAKEIGFHTPEYYASTDVEKISDFVKNKRYIAMNDVYNFKNLAESTAINPETLLAVEYIQGIPILVHVINDLVLSTAIYNEGSEPIYLPDQIRKWCLQITRELGLVVSEIFIKLTPDNKYYLYYVSLFPNWSSCCYDEEIYWGKITDVLNSKKINFDNYPASKTKGISQAHLKKSFIIRKHRPNVHGNYVEPACIEHQI